MATKYDAIVIGTGQAGPSLAVRLAGAGVKGGTILGATDEIGLHAITDRAHVNDLHATILHLMGLDHKQLTFLHSGRDERLTDVGGHVLEKILT